MPAKVTKLVGLKNSELVSPTNLISIYAVFDCGFIRRLLFKGKLQSELRLQFAFKQQSLNLITFAGTQNGE